MPALTSQKHETGGLEPVVITKERESVIIITIAYAISIILTALAAFLPALGKYKVENAKAYYIKKEPTALSDRF